MVTYLESKLQGSADVKYQQFDRFFAPNCDFKIVKRIIFNFNQNTNLRKYNNYELRVIRERKSLLVWIWSTCQAGFCWDSDLFGTPKHLFLSLPAPSDRLGANVKMSSTPFFPQKSFAKKFSKIQGQIWNNPLSNLNLAWEICEAFFCWLFFYLFVLSFLGWVYLLLSSQPNEMIHSVPESKI